MNIISVDLENFKCFLRPLYFNFREKGPGFHFITGFNQYERNLGANGVGKSTLLDAVCWGLYGKTLRGLRAGNVANWGNEQGFWVCVEIEIDDNIYAIRRAWNPNKLTINDELVSQERVDDLIRLNFESFQQAIIIGQFSPFFFDLPSATKMSMFEGVLNLDYWAKKSSAAHFAAVKTEHELDELERSVYSAQEAVEHNQKVLAREQEKADNFEEERQKLVDISEDEIQDLEKTRERLVNDRDALIKAKDKAEKQWAKIRDEGEHFEDILDDERDKLHSLQEKRTILGEQRKNLEAQMSKLTDIERYCPHCHQEVSEEHALEVLKDIKDEIELLNDDIIKLGTKIGTVQKKLETVRYQKEQYEDESKALVIKFKGFEVDISNKQSKIATVNENMRHVAARMAEDMNRDNLAAERVEECKEIIKDYEDRLEKDFAAVEKTTAYFELCKFWTKRFKDIRLYEIEAYLSQLEVEVNNCLINLGLDGWTIEFDVERETKSGGISKGFQVLIHSPSNDKPVPWEAWSGGETQRLRLAGTFGISNLIMNSLDMDLNIMFFDEPTQFLSEEGVEDLLALLHEQAQLLGKQIWLIDHRSLDFGGFSSITTLYKGKSDIIIQTKVSESGE